MVAYCWVKLLFPFQFFHQFSVSLVVLAALLQERKCSFVCWPSTTLFQAEYVNRYWKDYFGILFLLEVSRHPPLGLALNFVDICGSQTM